ncbi:hypothetical protein [Actinomadura nitritigenes]|uniref:hypothetical protein n=1 Tax=Actinomadura nitritigenes TaxID=134602 RepID=UPI003D916EFC
MNNVTENPLNHQFEYLARQIKAADSIPGLLTAAFIGLDLIERAITVLPDIHPDQAAPSNETALIEVTDAWWALSEAPTLAWPASTTMTAEDARQVAEAIAGFVLVVAEAMLNVASKSSDPGDRVACLRAAHHVGRLHAALK